ncbi:MAG: DUF2301 domain-containing membrane protein [Prochloron sp. SP5CPC1]|nr:DUF2301 domain-containing membrane protein [Candidatus Paraprochloron terpiosi SP5CPC1]
MTQTQSSVYQGQFGEFTVTEDDRKSVIIYRGGLITAALSFAFGTCLLLEWGATAVLTPLFALFSLGLGVSLLTIHIYLAPLHRLLQGFWLIGTVASGVLTLQSTEPLALYVYHHPVTLFGIGFTFAALTGIFFKEAVCFNRLETKFLIPVVPMLLLGHLGGVLSVSMELVLLVIWTVLFIIFAVRKAVQAIPPDIGDKSVFAHLKQQRLGV